MRVAGRKQRGGDGPGSAGESRSIGCSTTAVFWLLVPAECAAAGGLLLLLCDSSWKLLSETTSRERPWLCDHSFDHENDATPPYRCSASFQRVATQASRAGSFCFRPLCWLQVSKLARRGAPYFRAGGVLLPSGCQTLSCKPAPRTPCCNWPCAVLNGERRTKAEHVVARSAWPAGARAALPRALWRHTCGLPSWPCCCCWFWQHSNRCKLWDSRSWMVGARCLLIRSLVASCAAAAHCVTGGVVGALRSAVPAAGCHR